MYNVCNVCNCRSAAVRTQPLAMPTNGGAAFASAFLVIVIRYIRYHLSGMLASRRAGRATTATTPEQREPFRARPTSDRGLHRSSALCSATWDAAITRARLTHMHSHRQGNAPWRRLYLPNARDHRNARRSNARNRAANKARTAAEDSY